MNPRVLLQGQAHRLMFHIDPEHPQELRHTLDEWIRTLRGAQLADWGHSDEQCFSIWLPTPARLLRLPTKKGASILVRPLHQDLFSPTESSEAEEKVDAVIEMREGEGPFYVVVAGLFSRALALEGETLRKLAQKHQRSFERQVKSAIKEMSADPASHKAFLEVMATYLEMQEALVGASGPETLEQNLELLSRRLDRKKNWRLLWGPDQASDIKGGFFYLGTLRAAPIFLQQLGMDTGPVGVCSAALVASAMKKKVTQWESGESDVMPGQIIQDAFQALPWPMLFLGERGEVLQHNTAFVKMNVAPSRVVKLQEFEEVQTREQSWTVRRTMLASGQGERTLYTFIPENSGRFGAGHRAQGQDLGIITSSIAHELNNPIAGLLAAIELLKMDEHWDEESFSQLEEMKQGAQRCKQLVETFLGFSRIRPKEGQDVGKDLLKRCFEQALHLQRFRMVESGLRVEIEHEQRHPYSYPLHASTATMLGYLVLGELMTAFHHLKLLERRSSRGLVLKVKVIEDADSFGLVLDPVVSLKQGLSSKLLQYLLGEERLADEIRPDGALWFTRQNVLI
jgi:hypothetical protein